MYIQKTKAGKLEIKVINGYMSLNRKRTGDFFVIFFSNVKNCMCIMRLSFL